MSKKKQSVLKRMLSGFGIMYNKIANSNYVQGIKEEQRTANPNAFLPDEFKEPVETSPVPRRQDLPREKDLKRTIPPEKDTFATDFNDPTKIDF